MPRSTKQKHKEAGPRVFTVGHSTRSIEEFVELLSYNGIARVIDIRTIPKSRRNPQFNTDVLADALKARGIGYVHLKSLGGLRHPRKDSVNAAWRNPSFRGYADYMQTLEFEDALARALALAREKPSVLMCAEAVPWRCHRSLVADALTARGVSVAHITSKSRAAPHKMTPFARVEGTKVTYPGDGEQAALKFGKADEK